MAKIYNDFQPANLMSFAKSFARLNGQPLDKSEIWYSLAEAQAYAATDAAYVGQILAVIDTANAKVAFYGIADATGTLREIGAANVDVLSKAVEDLEKALNDENGIISQIDTINDSISSIEGEVGKVKEDLNKKANADNVYSIEEADSAIAAAIATMEHLSRKIVSSIGDIQDDIDNNLANIERIIYLVPALEGLSQDVYDEYMVINGAIEKMGSWETNLEGYLTKEEFNTEIAKVATKEELSGKVDIEAGKGLSSNDFTNELKLKLEGIAPGAEKNVVQTVSSDFVLEDRHLSLNNLPISKITGLQDELNKKVDAKAGYGLLSADDQLKLDKLVLENGELGVSGSISADNVIGLEAWLNKKADSVKGLSENNLTDDLADKLEQMLFISSVNTNQLKVTSGKLEIIAVDQSKITGLEEALNTKVSAATNDLEIRVDDITASLDLFVRKEVYDSDIAEIRDILTWKEIVK